LILAAALIALAACANTLDPPTLKQEAGTGTVYIVIDGDYARTLVPAPAMTFTRYTASFEGPRFQADVDLTGGSGSVNLAPGEWTITVTAFTGAGPYNDVGRGSATVTVQSDQTATANITLVPVTGSGKKGDFRYSITIPSVDSAILRLVSAADAPVGGTPINLKAAAGGSAGTAAGTLIDIDAGYYLMHIRLEQGGKYAGRTEAVHIYDGFETPAVYAFTNDDFFTVNTVTVNPLSVTVAKGATQTFTATVTGIGNPAQTVSWAVAGGSAGTTINITTGVLSVAANETAASLTVTATSTMDLTKSGTATVTVAMSAIETEVAAFKSAHSVILSKTVGDIATTDEAAVNTALSAYYSLSQAAQDLLGVQKTLLDNLKTKIGELKTAEAFKSVHSAILAKTVENIAIVDEAAVDNALAAYNSLAQVVKDLLTVEETLLDNLKTKIEELKVEAFRSGHSEILAKTVGDITISDETAVDAALDAYSGLSQAVKDLLTNEKTLLDSLKTMIEDLKAAEEFKSDHSVILSKAVGNIVIADGSAVNAALTAHSGLSQAAQDLLTAEKILLDSLKAKIDTLGVGAITTLVYPADAADDALSGSIIVYKIGGTQTQTLFASGNFDSYQWRVDGLTRGSGKIFALNAGDYTLGAHQISLEVFLNGVVYSKFGSFTVMP
jgi:hypothetical protein